MAGRYESWFLSARDAEPGRPPRALWIRHTRHLSVGAEQGTAALWCTVFDPAAGPPAAVKQTVPDAPPAPGAAGRQRPGGDGERRPGTGGAARSPAAGVGGFRGEARARGRMAQWELAVSGGGAPLRHLRPAALYRLPVPKTKLEAPVPDGIASGRVVVDGALVEVVGWRATVGHNWGREHAERWVWLHAAGFEDEPDAWLELAIARVRLGGALTPWIAQGAVYLGTQRFRLGGLGHVPGVRVAAAPGRLEAVVPGERAEIRVAAHADLDQTVAFRYAGVGTDPVAGAREVLHAGLAEVHLGVRRPGRSSAELATAAGGAYELGGREFTGAVPLQPYPDP